jgi:hypothetical protein
MIYAPRSKEELKTVMKIINASIGWISGEKFNSKPSEESQNNMPIVATNSHVALRSPGTTTGSWNTVAIRWVYFLAPITGIVCNLWF